MMIKVGYCIKSEYENRAVISKWKAEDKDTTIKENQESITSILNLRRALAPYLVFSAFVLQSSLRNVPTWLRLYTTSKKSKKTSSEKVRVEDQYSFIVILWPNTIWPVRAETRLKKEHHDLMPKRMVQLWREQIILPVYSRQEIDILQDNRQNLSRQ